MKPQTGKVRCIDIEAYMSSHPLNRKILDIVDNGVIEITKISPSKCGYVTHPDIRPIAISPREWEYFEPVSKYPNPPHKHAELIKAWADGAEIECQSTTPQWNRTIVPRWYVDTEYRIKPQKSEKDIQIEKLEEQAKQLAIDIAKLKET